MKKIYLVLALILSTNMLLASEKDDIAFLDELYKQKRFSTAITESVSFLQKYPNSKYTRNIQDRIAKAYLLQEDYKNAIIYFKMLLTNNNLKSKEKDEINFYLMKCYTALGETETSEFYLKSLDKNGIYYEKAFYDAGMTYLAKENYVKAEELFKKVIELDKKYADDSMLGLAMLAYNKGEYSKAVLYLDNYSKDRGKNKIMMNYLYGSAYYKQNRIEDAITAFKKVVNEDKTSAYGRKSMLNLIEIYSNRGNSEVVQEYVDLLKGTREYGEAMRMMGDLYATKEDYNRAISYYSKTNTPNDPKLMYGYGFSLYKLNRLKEAQKYFESLKKTDYYNQSLYYIFAIDYKLKNYSKIIRNREEIKRVVVSQQDTDNINLIIANSAYEVGDYKLSKDYYGRLFARTPNLENLYRIIVIDNKVNDIDDLQRRFYEYKNKYPNDTEYRRNIYFSVGEAYYKNGKVDLAIDTYKEFLSTQKDFNILNNLVISLLSEQRYDEMMEYLNSEENQGNIEIKYLKGIASVGMAKYDEADKQFTELENDPTIDATMLEKIKFNKMRNYFLWEKYDDAISYGESYLTLENGENRNEVIDKLAISYFRKDNFEKSREYYTKLLTVPEFEAYSRFQIAESYYSEKNYEKAKTEYKYVADNYGDSIYGERAFYWYLTILLNSGDTVNFEKGKNEFLVKYPVSRMKDTLLMMSGEIYENSNNNEEALKTYEELYSSSVDPTVKDNTASKILDIYLSKSNIKAAQKYVEGITNLDIKSYYDSLIYEKQGNQKAAMSEYQKLLNSPRYKDYACVNIGSKYFKDKKYKDAKKYYLQVNEMENSIYKDFVLYQLANISEIEGKNQEALSGYTKGYIMYNGQYSQVSKLKAAQLNEKMKKDKEAIVLYKELYSLGNELSYREFVIEKLIYLTLKAGNKVEASKYYDELKGINAEKAKKYADFFK